MQISNKTIIHIIDFISNEMFLIWLLLPLFIGCIPAVISRLKGRSFLLWYIYGVLLSSIIMLALAPTGIMQNIIFIELINYSTNIYFNQLNDVVFISVIIIITVTMTSFFPNPSKEYTARIYLHPSVVCAYVLNLLLATLPWTIFYCNALAYPPKPPIELPFAVHKAGAKAETEIRIADRRPCMFNLTFFCKKDDVDDRKRVEELVGESSYPLFFDVVEDNAADRKRIREWAKGVNYPVSIIENTDEHSSLDHEVQEIWLIPQKRSNHATAHVWLRPGRYRLNAESVQHIKQLLGDHDQKTNNSGIVTPLRLTINSLEDSEEHLVLVMENLEAQGRNPSDNIDRHIAWISLQPGHYRVRLESLQDVPELMEIPTAFSISYHYGK